MIKDKVKNNNIPNKESIVEKNRISGIDLSSGRDRTCYLEYNTKTKKIEETRVIKP